MDLYEAKELAEELVKMLRPFVDRIEIAGGVRRGKLSPHEMGINTIQS